MKHNDNNKQEEIDKILLSMTTPHAAPIIKSFYQFQEEHIAIVKEIFGNGIKHQEDVTDLMIQIINDLNFVDKSLWPGHRAYQFPFFRGALISLWRAFQDAVEGFYGESVMIIRSVFESYLRMVFISLYPQSWESAVYNKKLKDLPNFNVCNFLEHQLRVDWRWIYKLQSLYSHGKQFEVLEAIGRIARRTQEAPIYVKLVYDKNYFGMCLNYCLISTYALLTLIRDLFPELEDHSKLTKEGMVRFKASLEGFHILVEKTPSELSKTAVDIQKISKMVRAAEKGEDWRQLA